jgi:hypothetical protein
MSDAAHGGSLQHEVFSKPFKVQPAYELWDTPNSYRRYPGGKSLPAKMKVWRIQNTGKSYGSVVARSYGFNDSPDAEAIVPGYNNGKEYGAVGIGRHGNFLQWGFSGAPSQMTQAGKCLFLNCICYISRFDGKGPLIHCEQPARANAVRLALLINKIKDKRFFSSSFSDQLLDECRHDPMRLAGYYLDNYEFIYRDKTYCVDQELKDLGVESNRSIHTLERLISLLEDSKRADAAKRLLTRYTGRSSGTPEQWRKWLEQRRDRIYFSDVGGYRFYVVPKGYLTGPLKPPKPEPKPTLDVSMD